ncbi:major facilitator superfamily domain-containing protein [Lipomyces oligophaga]|uniref:major facilitator superfamily domain-containing protein n=1 Tax=Lipomyces oligophaga TaxID=45792 RepID=UPI0034CE097E
MGVKNEVKTKWERLREGVSWYRPGTTKEEKRLLRKLDSSILLFGCLSTFTKTLDNNSLTNAYVSGMKEDLNLGGNDLNYLQAVYYCSYLTFMIPASFLLTRLPIHRILPTMEILWGCCTFGCAWVTNLNQLYVCRFFLGGCETVAFTGVLYVIGSWYLVEEMGCRMAMYQLASPLGGMIAGYLMTATHTHLDGRSGRAGWRWLFIVCFCITIPCAAIGFTFFPSTPSNTKPTWWLSQADIDLTNRRLREEGIRKLEKRINWKALTRILRDWPWYFFVFGWCLYDQNQYWSGTPFSLYMKGYTPANYSVSQINNYPTVVKAVAIVVIVVGSYYSDKTGDMYSPAMVSAIFQFVGAVMLRVFNVGEGGRLFAYFIGGFATGISTFQMTWASSVVKEDPEARSIITASMNCIGQVFLAWVPIFTFPSDKAPYFKKGFTFSVITGILHMLLLTAIFFLERRDLKSGRRFRKLEGSRVGDEFDVDSSLPGDRKETKESIHSIP